MRIGIYGGSFDPVHLGHLLVAECCREQASLDEVWFVPLATPVHKSPESLSGVHHRLQMLKLATGGNESFRVATLEVDRGGTSYTVDTLEELHREDASRELFLILGADSLADLPSWKDPARICQLATLLVVARAETPKPDFELLASFVGVDKVDRARSHQVSMPAIGLASRDLRRRVAERRSIRYRTPRAVEMYIHAQGLYR